MAIEEQLKEGSRGELRRRPQETQGHNMVYDEPVAESGSV